MTPVRPSLRQASAGARWAPRESFPPESKRPSIGTSRTANGPRTSRPGNTPASGWHRLTRATSSCYRHAGILMETRRPRRVLPRKRDWGARLQNTVCTTAPFSAGIMQLDHALRLMRATTGWFRAGACRRARVGKTARRQARPYIQLHSPAQCETSGLDGGCGPTACSFWTFHPAI